MIIILCLYVVALWAVFSKFKLVRWGWLSGTVSLLIGEAGRFIVPPPRLHQDHVRDRADRADPRQAGN